MVKTIFITFEDQEHARLKELKDRRELTWKELILKVEKVLR